MTEIWRDPPTRLDLLDGKVHVWRLPLAEVDPEMASVLAEDERERATRFHFQVHRHAFSSARAGLRVLLGTYMGLEPSLIAMSYTKHGKPYVDGNVCFNVSHAGDIALYAFAAGRDIGVDVEQLSASVDHDQLAERFFSHGEQRGLLSLPPAGRRRAFFDCWTRKEAFVKAIGEGLSIPLSDFEVSIERDDPRVLWIREGLSDANDWTMHSFTPADGYAGAVAVRHPRAELRLYDLHPASLEEAVGSLAD